jgi:hypothetical protein
MKSDNVIHPSSTVNNSSSLITNCLHCLTILPTSGLTLCQCSKIITLISYFHILLSLPSPLPLSVFFSLLHELKYLFYYLFTIHPPLSDSPEEKGQTPVLSLNPLPIVWPPHKATISLLLKPSRKNTLRMWNSGVCDPSG